MSAATRGKVLTDWNTEDPTKWNSKVAWTTLVVTTYSLFLGFAVWFLPNAIASKLTEIGFNFGSPEETKAALYWLTAMPGLSAAVLRLVYVFIPATVGTRKMVIWSSLLYVLPMAGWFFAVQDPTTPYWVLLLLSFASGIGGGVFSGYMPSTGYFFPKRLQGTALGLQGGLGNLGMSFIQLGAPLLMSANLVGVTLLAPDADPSKPMVVNAVIFMVPWAILAAVLGFITLRDVPVKANFRQQLDIFGNANTWYMTVLYIMTFGLFSGFGAQTALIINANFGKLSPLAATHDPSTLPVGLSYAFLGTLVGALLRFAWGPLCDKFGGAIWTFVSAIGMGLSLAFTGWVLMTTDSPSDFTPFLIGMLVMFLFAGIGNASTFKQMPMIMPTRQAGGAIGFTAAVASLGPFLVGVALTAVSAHTFYFFAAAYCAICAVLAWVRFARPGAPFPG
ncbi:MFS transporter [Buchananella felis]|uniref:MFS transporter n=1 Tax=Buchananella felis TaxID=3231492 RepID=UPI003526D443